MTAIAHHRKDLMIEGQYLPSDLDDLEVWRQGFQAWLEAGGSDDVDPSHGENLSYAIAGWLNAKRWGGDKLTPGTRSKYRRILAQLAEHEGGPDGERGSASPAAAFLALVGGVATVAAASGRPVAMAIASPIIYERDVMSPGEAVAA